MSQNTIIHSIKSEIKNNLSVSAPLISSQLIYASTGFIGIALVARLGKDALAASVLVTMIWFSLCVFFFGILNASSVLVAHQFGAKNDKTISKIMGQSYLLGAIISILIMLVLCIMPWFLRWSAQPPNVLKLAYQYMHAMAWTVPALVMLILSEQFLAGISRAKIVLRISILVVPLEILLIYALIFGKAGLPNCGIAGIGYGFAVSYTITAVGLILYLLKAAPYQRYQLFRGITHIDWSYQKELIRVGLPMGFMQAIEVSTFAVMTIWLGHFGSTVLAAHQIAIQYLSLAITLVFAMSQAVTIRVGHAVGALDLIGIRYAVYVGMLMNFIGVLIIASAFIFFPTFFLQLDINPHNAANQTLLTEAIALLSIAGVLMLCDNFRIIGFGALRGLKDTRFPMYVSLISFWCVGLTLAFFLGFKTPLQGNGIWWGVTLGIAVGAVIVLIRLRYLIRDLDAEKLAKISHIA